MLKQHLAVPVLHVHYTHYMYMYVLLHVYCTHTYMYMYMYMCIYTAQEEDRIIRKEAVILKERVGARDTTPVSALHIHAYTCTCTCMYSTWCTHLRVQCTWTFASGVWTVVTDHYHNTRTHAHTHTHMHAHTHTRQMREYLIRLIYCEMLGHECSWGYIHAVKFTQSTGFLDKRIGKALAEYYMFRHTCVHVHVYVHTSVYIKLSITWQCWTAKVSNNICTCVYIVEIESTLCLLFFVCVYASSLL